jgi:hypothetical protein
MMKSQIRPRRITIELLINVKGINVILHGLRTVHADLAFAFRITPVPLPFVNSKVHL